MPKILAIDDEVGFTTLVTNYFSPRGYQVFVANRAETGMELVKKENPDVILMDLKMPGLDGDEALKKILQFKPDAKMIMITAMQNEGKNEEYLIKLGAFAYFEKPIASMRALEDKIKEAAQGTV